MAESGRYGLGSPSSQCRWGRRMQPAIGGVGGNAAAGDGRRRRKTTIYDGMFWGEKGSGASFSSFGNFVGTMQMFPYKNASHFATDNWDPPNSTRGTRALTK